MKIYTHKIQICIQLSPRMAILLHSFFVHIHMYVYHKKKNLAITEPLERTDTDGPKDGQRNLNRFFIRQKKPQLPF